MLTLTSPRTIVPGTVLLLTGTLFALSWLQPPGSILNLPAGNTAEKVHFSGTVNDYLGQLYNGNVTLIVQHTSAERVSVHDNLSVQAGVFIADVYIEDVDIQELLKIQLWHEHPGAEFIESEALFTNPLDKRAAFIQASATVGTSATVGDSGPYEVDLGTCKLARIPHVGDVVISPALGGPHELRAQPLEYFVEEARPYPDLVETLPSGSTTVALYSWGTTNGWNLALHDSLGEVVARKTVRRGDSVTMSVSQTVSLSGTVDSNTYPNASLVTAYPNAEVPNTGNASINDMHNLELIGEFGYSGVDSSGIYETLLLQPGTYRIRLWDAFTSPPVAEKTVTLSGGAQSVNFP